MSEIERSCEWLASVDTAAMWRVLNGFGSAAPLLASHCDALQGYIHEALSAARDLPNDTCCCYSHGSGIWGLFESLRLHDLRREQELIADVIRDMVGDPFVPRRPDHLDWRCGYCGVIGRSNKTNKYCEARRAGNDPVGKNNHRWTRLRSEPWLRWNNGAVLCLAEHIRSEGLFDEMPILADALEDAGCADEFVLMHARGWKPCPVELQQSGFSGRHAACARCADRPGWCRIAGPHTADCWLLRYIRGSRPWALA